MFVQYICAQVVFSVDLLEAVKVIDEYSFENVLRHPVTVLRIKHRQKQERVTNTLPRLLEKSSDGDFRIARYVMD